MPNVIALVPARSGSERVPKKNIRKLGGHPLIGWTLSTANQFGRFERIIVSSDSTEILTIAAKYGGENLGPRPSELSTSVSPDFYWIKHTVQQLQASSINPDAIFILRPTSPFRTTDTLERAWKEFFDCGNDVTSMRAVQPVRQHPGKMWIRDGNTLIQPLLNGSINSVPLHSNQSKILPQVFIQNSSLEVLWTETLATYRNITGPSVAPFFTSRLEGFSIDHPEDWKTATEIVNDQSRQILLPQIEQIKK